MHKPGNTDDDPNQSLIISYLAIRKFVGILGFTLPFITVSGTLVFSDCTTLLPSISQYYYSVMGNFLVGSLCGVAVFMFSYKGYSVWDRVLSMAAGFFAVATAFFPTHLSTLYYECDVNVHDCSDLTDIIHSVTAALFFITLALMSIVLFTKSKGEITPQKIKRNKIYRICGYTILVSITFIGLYQIPSIHAIFGKYKLTVFLEALALAAFGFSWLTKGEFLLKDE